MHARTPSTTASTPTRRLLRASAAIGTLLVTALVGLPPSAAVADTFTAPSDRCFIEQPHWNVALDGPVPRCPDPPLFPAGATLSPAPGWAAGGEAADATGELAWVGGMTRAT